VTVSQVEWIATPSWGGAGAAQHLTGADTGSGFHVSATFTVPASIAVPIVQVKGSAKLTDSTGSQVIHMAGQITLSPTGTMCISWALAFNYVQGQNGELVRQWVNGKVAPVVGDVELSQGVGPC
jgi:hypothetical protein